ncbi:MAG: PolC-type DNA polymerase III [Firmicutes bacterium]|nr:PolC-type DNA polymerase III [Alicyclobacillaceae bacterium]MCL6496813.1 PolC-type DNA polymerase III [Bacillota bacterium]
MDESLKAWLEAHGITPSEFVPVRAEWCGADASVRLVLGRWRPEWEAVRTPLATWLGQAFGCAVELVAAEWPSDPEARLRAVMQALNPVQAALWETVTVVPTAEGLTVHFPSAWALDLFQRWGGAARLAAVWPDLPPLTLEVRALPQPEPDPVVALSADAGGARRRPPEGHPQPYGELQEGQRALVEGQVFQRVVRTTREGRRFLVLSLHQGPNALKARLFERQEGDATALEAVAEGDWLRLEGVWERPQGSEEPELRVEAWGWIDPEPLADGTDEPRVEMHLHTKMSAMDGLIEVGQAFQLARDLGHPAVAVVDHGVVQAYPEADSWARRTGVKALYGVEVYMVPDALAPAQGTPPVQGWWQGPWVVVDVETTGLTPWTHEVMEIGAVRWEKGRVTDRFHRLVRPRRRVSEASLAVTGIDPGDLAQASDPESVWPEFFQFCQGAVLVAHNAPYDLGFLRRAWAAIASDPFPFAAIDTLTWARLCLPGLKSYGLEPLCDHFRIALTHHHRALADAEATLLLAHKLREESVAQGWKEDEFAAKRPVDVQLVRPVPVVLLLRQQAGIEPLYELVSRSHLETFHRVPRVRRSWIDALRPWVWVGAPMHGGEVSEALYRAADEAEVAAALAFYDYVELAPVEGAHPWLRDEEFGTPEAVQAFQAALVARAEAAQVPVVAVSDAHYLRPEDAVLREILGDTAKGELHERGAALHYRTTAEMLAAFAWLGPEQARAIVIENPRHFAETAEAITPVPDGLHAPSLAEAETVVSQLPWQRARALYGDPLPQVVAQRLEREIAAIVTHGFASIYYIAHRLVQKSLQDGYLVGSRGSVGSSLVATLLQITEVNPLPPHYRCPQCAFSQFEGPEVEGYGSGFDLPPRRCPRCGHALVGDGHDIPFETFLGFEGDKVPDIDLNFSGEYQPEIHRYAESLFGKGHVFRAGTIATVADKTAYGLVKAWARDHGKALRGVEVDWLARGLTGVKRTTGQHPGGLMVVPETERVYRFTPVQHPADDHEAEVITTHFDYHAIEGRLLKLDLLGHDDPTAIRMLEELTGVDAKAVPFQDPATMALFSGTESLGVSPEAIGTPVGSLGIPEFGTRFVRTMLTETRPTTFAELVRISGLSHGTEVWTNNAQDLIRRQVANLSQVIATRDDIMIYLLRRGLAPKTAFGISEAVRKGKGLSPDQAEEMRRHGVPEWYLESCRKITYLFPKAHAAAYVMMGWRIAWFKVHHPLAFYATYFSVRADDFDVDVALGGIPAVNQTLAELEGKGPNLTPKERNLVTVLEVMREMMVRGFHFYPVDLMRSQAARFAVEEGGLRIPFAALPGLGAAAAEAIVKARQEAPFLSVDDLRTRARLARPVVDLLRKFGVLKGLGETSQLVFF